MINEFIKIPLFEIWLNERTKLSPRSIRAYVRVANQFLKEESPRDFNDSEPYMNFLVRTAIKKRNYHNVYAIRMFVRFVVEDDKARQSILSDIKILNIQPKASVQYIDKKPLSEKEMGTLLGNFKHYKHYIMSLIMFETGARIGDILNIKKGAIEVLVEHDKPVMKLSYIGKGGKLTTKWIWNLSVAEKVQDYIEQNISNTDYAFVNISKTTHKSTRSLGPKETTICQDSNALFYWADLKEALGKSDIERDRFAAHCFRRDYAKRVWNWSRNMDTLQRLMGHANPDTTMLYLKQTGYQTSEISKDFFYNNI